MLRFIAVCLTFLLTLSSALALPIVPVEHRVQNVSPGYCAYSCVEMCCRTQGVTKGHGLMKARASDRDELIDGWIIPKNAGHHISIERKLKSLGIKSHIVPAKVHGGNREDGLRLIRESLASGRYCTVAFDYSLPPINGCHAVVLMEFDETTNSVLYFDPNFTEVSKDGTSTYFKTSVTWFNQYWTGLVVSIIDRNEQQETRGTRAPRIEIEVQ